MVAMPNLVKFGQTAAEVWRFFDFSRWRPSAILDLLCVYSTTHEGHLVTIAAVVSILCKFLANVNSRLSVCLSVCNVRAPYSGGSNFRQRFYGIIGTLATR